MCAEETVSRDEIAAKLRTLLSAHSEEVEEAIVARMQSSGLDIPPLDAEGLVGVRPSARESMNTMIESFENGDDWDPVLPPALISQIRYAARQGVSLEAVMRGVGIIGSVFIDSLFQKLDDRDAPAVLQYMAAWQSRNQDKIMTSFAAEYTAELRRLEKSPTHALGERVRELLAGQSADTKALGYRLDGCHIGLIAIGEKVDLLSRRLAETLGCDRLIVPDAEDTFWIWLGAPRPIEFSDFERSVSTVMDTQIVGAGEPREGIVGWRLTHQEAEAAAPVAKLEGSGLARHSNVALLASALCHEETGRSLVDRYLKPLDRHRDADDLRRTLRVYFELSCNAASTASTLSVNRHTVQRRLKRVEESIGEPPSTRQAEFAVALRLERLTTRTRTVMNS
jgi:hypothetical protein